MENYPSSEKIESFRSKMKAKELDAYIIIHGDAHNNEFPDPCNHRMSFICGFAGSYGICVITMAKCALFTDERYEIQAPRQLEKGWELTFIEPTSNFISQYFNSMKDIKTIGFDAYTTTISAFQKISGEMSSFQFCPQSESIIDEIWVEERPTQKFNSIFNQPMEFAGINTQTKVENIKKHIKNEKVNSIFNGISDEIAWVLNMRGSDITHTPVFNSYLFISQDSNKVYVNKESLTDEAHQSLKEYGFEIMHYHEAAHDMQKYSKEMGEDIIMMDPRTSYAFFQIFDPAQVKVQISPISHMKSIKNPMEIEGMKKAQLKDSVAMCKFFCWLDKVTEDGTVFNMEEIDVKEKADGYRAEMDGYRSASFGTISASGENTPTEHYFFKPKKEYNIDTSMKKMLYLIDSGGQYVEGTTDITRTTHLGEPTDYEKLCYTLVLKGHIAVATLVFPPGTKGPAIDAISRKYLWKYGMDFTHGTGHGVGAALSVHEGPIKVSKILEIPYITTNLEPGIVISNEPGTYQKKNGLGIRIENMITVINYDTQFKYSGLQFYQFETITMVPIETKLIDFSLMTKSEIDWLNKYHQKVWEKVEPMFKEEEKKKSCDYSEVIEWLYKKTQPV